MSTTEPRIVVGDPEQAAADLLAEAQLFALRHPAACQAIVRALVAEGRRFADTPSGARWRRRLSRSGIADRGRVLWEGSALGMFEDEGEAVLPAALLDALLTVLTSRNWRTLAQALAPVRGVDDARAPE